MDLHVFVLNWNGAKYLPGLYSSFISLTNTFNRTIWHIRDNGSKDNSIEIMNGFKGQEINIYEVGHNRDSFAKGMNFLYDRSQPTDDDVILFLNNDVFFPDNTALVNMKSLLDKGANIVGLRLLYMNSNKLQHAGVIFSSKYNNLPFHYRPGEESDKEAEKDRWFQAVTAAVCMVRASEFRGMNEDFIFAFEDIDMCLDIGKVAYCGRSYAFHEESVSLRKNPVQKMYQAHNVKVFRDKWTGKYDDDLSKYLKDPNYNAI